MSKHDQPRGGCESPVYPFEPVILRSRHDGWSADKQVEFIQALAECGCVTEACARVGMTTPSAYGLRARLDAQSFRLAWDAALDHAVRRLSDAAFSRALNGVATPVFFQGEQIAERRRYDERLTMFLLRYRDPERYSKWTDGFTAKRRHPDGAYLLLARKLLDLLMEGDAFDGGRTVARPAKPVDPDEELLQQCLKEVEEEHRQRRIREAARAQVAARMAGGDPERAAAGSEEQGDEDWAGEDWPAEGELAADTPEMDEREAETDEEAERRAAAQASRQRGPRIGRLD